MLYIASALPSTAITHSLSIPTAIPLLVVAKGNVLAVFEAREEGLVGVWEEEVWGIVVGLEWVGSADNPHIIALTDHPLPRLLLYSLHPSSSSAYMRLTAHHTLTPSSRPSEFLTTLVADRERGLVVGCLYAGVLIVAEVGVGKGKVGSAGKVAKGRRRDSERGEGMEVDVCEVGEGGLVFKEVYDIPIREHNLLSLHLLPTPPTVPPTLLLLHLTPSLSLHLSSRSLLPSRSLSEDLTPPIDVLSNPAHFVPAARRLVGIPGGAVVVGDEFSAAWEFGWEEEVAGPGHGRKKSISSSSSRSEVVGKLSPEAAKRRRGSLGGSLVPVPAGRGEKKKEDERGLRLVVKEGWRVRQGFGEVIAATAVKGEGRTCGVLLGDEMGRLSMISYLPGTKQAEVSLLGVTSAATSLSYLDSSHIFLSSEMGDSQLLSLQSSPVKGKGKARDTGMDVDGLGAEESAFEVKEEWANVAPVRDFCVVEEEGGGASQILTASGAGSTGSLRIVRSGVGMETLVSVEGLGEVDAVFGIPGCSTSKLAEAFLITNTETSAVLAISGTSELDFSLRLLDPSQHSLDTSTQTLAFGQVGTSSLVQITKSQARFLQWGSMVTEGVWNAPAGKDIVVAEVNKSMVVLGLGGGEMVVLELAEGTVRSGESRVGSERRVTFDSEIACVDVTPTLAPYTSSPIIAVGFWGTNTVQLISTSALQPLAPPLREASLPTSLRLRASTSPGHIELLVGLGDGTLVVYLYDTMGDVFSVKDRKEMALGRTPLRISQGRLGSEGEMLVVLSDRASVLFEEQERLAYSSISGKPFTAAAMIDTVPFGTVLLSASEQGLNFSRITSLKKLHVRKVDLGFESPHAIAYHEGLKVYGAALNKTTLEQEYGNEDRSSCFRLYDATSFEAVAELPLSEGEVVVSLNKVILHGTAYFSLGTSFPGDGEPGAAARGRIRLIEGFSGTEEDPQFTLAVVGQLEMGGTVYDSKSIWGRLVVAVENRVDLIELDTSFEDPSETLKVISSWGNAFLACGLSVQTIPRAEGEPIQRLHVGDGMRSVFALELNTKNELVDVGRDISPHWVMTMEELESEGGAVAFSDTSYNVLTMRHKDNHLENAAGMALHETVTRFRKGALAPSTVAKESVKSELLFATSSGRIGVVADVGNNEAKILGDLQRNMDAVVTGPGVTWQDYREVHTEGNAKPRRTLGFIDGDFVKHFLELSVTDQENGAPKVLRGANEFERVGAGLGKAGASAERNDVVRVLEVVGALH